MTKEQLKIDLLKGLNNTVAEEVTLQIEHVLAFVSEDTANKLAMFVVETQSPLTVKKNSAIPPEKRMTKTGLGRFNREQIIAAIESGSAPASKPVPAPAPKVA